jgi:hypothetical protein
VNRDQQRPLGDLRDSDSEAETLRAWRPAPQGGTTFPSPHPRWKFLGRRSTLPRRAAVWRLPAALQQTVDRAELQQVADRDGAGTEDELPEQRGGPPGARRPVYDPDSDPGGTPEPQHQRDPRAKIVLSDECLLSAGPHPDSAPRSASAARLTLPKRRRTPLPVRNTSTTKTTKSTQVNQL